MSNKEVALDNQILRGLVGSTCHGTAIEGQDDRDEMGVFIEPPAYVCGLDTLDHYIYRSQPEGVRSGPGDLDLTLYSLRKFTYLAAKGNPSVILLLWLKNPLFNTLYGQELIKMRTHFISRNAGNAYIGYLISQKRALLGEKTKAVTRPELIEKYGFDTKYAMHALRLGLQGIEYLTEGGLSVPVREPDLSILRAVRSGGFSLEETIKMIETTEERLKKIVSDCDWEVNYDMVNDFLVDMHQRYWDEN